MSDRNVLLAFVRQLDVDAQVGTSNSWVRTGVVGVNVGYAWTSVSRAGGVRPARPTPSASVWNGSSFPPAV